MKRLYKKGGSELFAPDTVPFYLVFAFLLAILVIVFVSLISNESEDAAKIPEGIRDRIYGTRFLSVSNCFALENDFISRTYPFTVDLLKFTAEQLEGCYATGATKKRAYELSFPSYATADPERFVLSTTNWDSSFLASSKKQFTTRLYGDGYDLTTLFEIGIQNDKTD